MFDLIQERREEFKRKREEDRREFLRREEEREAAVVLSRLSDQVRRRGRRNRSRREKSVIDFSCLPEQDVAIVFEHRKAVLERHFTYDDPATGLKVLKPLHITSATYSFPTNY